MQTNLETRFGLLASTEDRACKDRQTLSDLATPILYGRVLRDVFISRRKPSSLRHQVDELYSSDDNLPNLVP